VLPPPVISAAAAAAPPLKLQSSCHRSQFCCLPRVEGWSPPIPATGRRRRLLSKNFLAATIYCETRTRASQSAANAVTMHKQESAVSCPFSKGRNVKCPRAVDKTTIGYVRGWMKHRAQEHGQDQRRAEYKSTGSEGAEYKSTGALEHWKHRNTGTVLYTEPSGRLMLCCERAVQSGKDQNTHTKSKIQNTKYENTTVAETPVCEHQSWVAGYLSNGAWVCYLVLGLVVATAAKQSTLRDVLVRAEDIIPTKPKQ
jgi:hypothetical protein